MPLVVTRAVAADAGRIAGLHRACFDEPWGASAFERLLTQPTSLAVVVRSGEALVGFAVCRLAADECEVLSCAVEHSFRRTGVGRRMLAAVFDEAARRGARHTVLEVAAGNGPARALYAALGLRPVGRRCGYYARSGSAAIDALVMSSDL